MCSDISYRIIIIEDDEHDSFMLARQLKKAGIDDLITLFTNGQRALEYLLACNDIPLVIFLDLHIPGLSGIELLTTIRNQSRLKVIPVIIMTGSINPNDLDRSNVLGITAYLAKPISLTNYIRAISHLIPECRPVVDSNLL
jgi:CheY-like chemotaxis protein